jgi:hypothetical protein
MMMVPFLLGNFGGSCNRQASRVDHNLTVAADEFEIYRRITFYNGITDKYILVINGYCSISHERNQLEVICKTPGGFKKHFLGLSDNVTYISEHMEASHVDHHHYRVIFKPSTLIPSIEVK